MILYPNPTSGSLSIDISPDLVDQNAIVKIISLDGKTIFKNTAIKLKPTTFLDLKNVPPGKYIINIEDDVERFSKSLEVIR